MTTLEFNVELLKQDIDELCAVLLDKKQGSPVSCIETSMLRLIEIYELLGTDKHVERE